MSKTLQVAILLAGGSGQRFGADRPKQFVRIGERTVLEQIRILIHDAVRPAVSQSIIERVCTALHTHQAANLVVPVTDTLLEVNDNGTTATMPSRARFRRVQTPQGFHAATLQHAYDVALTDPNFQATDDCGIVFRYLPEVEIALVEGEQRNIKLTYPEDLHVLHHLLEKS